ncbi:MAG: TolB family protein [Flavobacteriales bacterium]
MKKIISLLLLGVCFATRAQNNNDELFIEDTVSIFQEGKISTHRNERDLCIKFSSLEINKLQFSELYYTLQDPGTGFSVIMTSHFDGTWSEPIPVSFSGNYNDLEPFITPDGNWMYFASNRSVTNGTASPDYNIWRSKRDGKKWGKPEKLGNGINTNENEFYPSVNNNGDLYFTAERKNGVGKEDIYVARKNDTSFAQPVPLDTGVNSTLYEFNAWIAPDDSIIIFTSYGRKDDMGRGDLYISKKSKTGGWLPAVHLEGGINSKKLDYCPYVDANGNFYFTSERVRPRLYHVPISTLADWDAITIAPANGNSDIYRVPSYFFRDVKRKALGEEE